MALLTALEQLSDEHLHGEVKRLVGRANTLTAELLAHLGEVEARGIHRERACSSLYTYCIYELCMSEDEAQRRCRAARLARQFPALLEMLAEASIHLTGILLIGPQLTTENQSELLERVRYRSKREIERIVGELAPAPDAPMRIEVLHGEQAAWVQELDADLTQPRNTWAAYVRALAGPVRRRSAGTAAGEAPPRAAPESCVDVTASSADESGAREVEPLQREPARQSADGDAARPSARYRVQFTVDQEYLDLLEEARDLLQHVLPDRDRVEVQRRALHLLVKTLRTRKAGAARPRAALERKGAPDPDGPAPERAPRRAAPERKGTSNAAGPAPERKDAPARRRHVPAQVRRTVWQRDDGRCAYADVRGQRCRERAGLEFHHRHPHARGGPESTSNLELRCRAHNALAAEHDFGREHMRKRRRHRRAQREQRACSTSTSAGND